MPCHSALLGTGFDNSNKANSSSGALSGRVAEPAVSCFFLVEEPQVVLPDVYFSLRTPQATRDVNDPADCISRRASCIVLPGE